MYSIDGKHSGGAVGGGLRFIPPNDRGRRLWDFSAPSNLYMLQEQPRLYGKAIENRHYAKHLDEPLRQTIVESLNSTTLRFRHPLRMVDLGPGYPRKSVPVLLRIKRQVGQLVYSPVDVSPFFLKLACQRMARIRGVTVCAYLQLFENLDRSDFGRDVSRQLVVSIGPTFMNFRADFICGLLKRLTKKGDLCLICAQYRNPTVGASALLEPYQTNDVERFNFSVLHHLGFNRQAVVYFARLRNSCIEMGFRVVEVAQHIGCLGFRVGDGIITARSYRYPLNRYRAILHSLFPQTVDTVNKSHSIVVSWCVRGG